MNNLNTDYQLNYARYKYYYKRLARFYQKPVAQVSTSLLLTIFAVIFFAIFAIQPTLITIAQLLETIEQQRQTEVQLKQKAAALANAQQELTTNQQAIANLNQALPADPQTEDLIWLLEATAADSQVAITSLNLSNITLQPSSQTMDDADITPVPFNLSLVGTYPNLKLFIERVSRLPRFIIPSSISFKLPNSRRLDTLDQNQLIEVSLSVEAYYQPLVIAP